MGELVKDSDIAFLHALYPSVGLEPLTSQEEKWVLMRIQGMSPTQAEKAVGMPVGKGLKLAKKKHIQIVLEYLREKEFEDVRMTRGRITQMFLDAHGHAATATEEVMATRELAKLHDLYKDEINKREARGGGPTTINIEGDLTVKQINNMTDDELAAVAGVIDLDPANYEVIHDEKTRVTEQREEHTGRPDKDTDYVPPGHRQARARAAKRILDSSVEIQETQPNDDD
jgi:hypothetical protein